jgi:ribosomal protein S25
LASESTNTPLRVIDLLAANLFITTTDLADRWGLAFTTALCAIERLERNHIVQQQTTNAKRSCVCCAQSLLEILEEPARLAPQTAE